MGLLDGALAAAFASALTPLYSDATLHRRAITDNGKGGGSVGYADTAVKAQLDGTATAFDPKGGYVDAGQKIIVLARGLAPIGTDDELTIKGSRWMIDSVGTDPAGAYYALTGRRKA